MPDAKPHCDAYRIDVLTEDDGWETWCTVTKPETAIKTEAYVSGFYRDVRVIDLYLVGDQLKPAFEPADA